MSTMTTTTKTTENETTILIRVLCDEDGKLPPDVARYILERKFNEQDKARMHHLIEAQPARRSLSGREGRIVRVRRGWDFTLHPQSQSQTYAQHQG